MSDVLIEKLLEALIKKTANNKILWVAEFDSGRINYICPTPMGDIIVYKDLSTSRLPDVFLRINEPLKHLLINIIEPECNSTIFYLRKQLGEAIATSMKEREDWEDWVADVIASLPD